ncbi:MAG TPA: hypothetical protein VK868_15280 [Pyrinomonadaceae bacterium]|nr:hypothetical protein [Pyrinomonadaceae bacterium]
MIILLSDLISSIPQLLREWFTLNPAEPFKTAVKVASIAGTLVTIVTTLSTKSGPWLAAKIKTRSISRHLSPEFTVAGIHRSIRYYIRALCQNLDPAGAEEPRLVFGVQQRLFEALDRALTHPTEHNFIFLLADSGMGKTSALINYYARHLRRFRKPFKLFLIPLGIPDADERIAKITDRAGSVLFLDALDEDTLAMVDHAERLRTLLNLTRDFERVLISCRTQFFSKDEEIPRETGKIKVSSRAAGESAEYYFHKIYLSPFNDNQVVKYLKRRYPIWRYRRRRKAHAIVKKIPNLTVRPMLLAHVDDIVQSNRDIQYSYQLYEEMIDAWLKREQGFIQKTDDLRQFSERLAVDLYLNRRSRGSERIERAQLVTLAQEWGIPLEDWKLSGRSLLNRDADGNYKFAHRSIMEYLFVVSFLEGEGKCLDEDWTDQMVDFYMEMLEHNEDAVFKSALQLVKEITKGALVVSERSRGKRFFKMILTESRSNNLKRRNLAKTLFGRLCFEMLNPEHRDDMNLLINLPEVGTPEADMSSPAVVGVRSTDRSLNWVQVYAPNERDVPAVTFARGTFEDLYGPAVELDIFVWGGYVRMMIELNGQTVGSLVFNVVARKKVRPAVIRKRWSTLESLLNPTKSLQQKAAVERSFTEEAEWVLREASTIASLQDAASVEPPHLLRALIIVNRSLFAQIFSLRSAQIERVSHILSVKNPISESDHQRRITRTRSRRVRQRQLSHKVRWILRQAESARISDSEAHIAWKHLLLALLNSNDEMFTYLPVLGVDYARAKVFFENRDR